jgi:hypothetical protein
VVLCVVLSFFFAPAGGPDFSRALPERKKKMKLSRSLMEIQTRKKKDGAHEQRILSFFLFYFQ